MYLCLPQSLSCIQFAYFHIHFFRIRFCKYIKKAQRTRTIGWNKKFHRYPHSPCRNIECKTNLLLVVVQSRLQEIDVLVDILVIRIGLVQRLAFIVYQHIERLGIGTELDTLQVAPLVAHGT